MTIFNFFELFLNFSYLLGNNIFNTLTSVNNILVISYLLGIFFSTKSMLLLRIHNDVEIHLSKSGSKAMIFLLIAAIFLSIPTLLTTAR